MIGELETLMTRDTSGMRIILIDNPKADGDAACAESVAGRQV